MEMKEGDVFENDYCITEQVYKGFIALFNDNNPLHTDEDFARTKNFSGKVMHGAIQAGFLSNFIGEKLPLKNVIVQTYKMAFTKPVYCGDKLTLKAIITGVFESVNCITFKYTFTNSTPIVVSKGEITIGLI